MAVDVLAVQSGQTNARNVARDVLIVAAVVFLTALFGIMTRPVGFLAAFWPANALLLALFIRYPRLASPAGWASAALAYVAADLVTGGDVLRTMWLTGANLVGVLVGYAASMHLPDEDRKLRRPRSMLYIFGICMAGAAASGLVGGYAAQAVFGRDFLTGAAFWFTTEFVNAAIIVPLVLTAPSWSELVRQAMQPASLKSIIPLMLVLLSVVLSHMIGGPGVLAFPVPALVVCALTYSLFTTAALTLAVCAWQMIVTVGGVMPFPMTGDPMQATLSVRLGIALVALGPLTVASVNAARNELLASLNHAASHDYLTDALSRSAFVSKATALLARLTAQGRPAAMLTVDIDRFKNVNDKYGHAAGDRVLQTFAAMVREVLRERDIFGRIGGEEFAIVLPDVSPEEAKAVAERIRIKIASTPIPLDDGRRLRVTVSMGMTISGTRTKLEAAMAKADAALYCAKESGRNRVIDAAGLFSERKARRA